MAKMPTFTKSMSIPSKVASSRSIGTAKPATSSVKMPRFSDDETLPVTRVNKSTKTHRGY